MIVKKLYRKIKFKGWDKKRNVYEIKFINDYIGWFLFGVIPIYLTLIDSVVEYDLEYSEITRRKKLYQKCGRIINGGSFE